MGVWGNYVCMTEWMCLRSDYLPADRLGDIYRYDYDNGNLVKIEEISERTSNVRKTIEIKYLQ